MSDTLRVAVFCGFGEIPKRSSEMLFAYQLLALFSQGTLHRKELKDSAYALERLRRADAEHGSPLFSKFSIFNVPRRQGILSELKDALSGDTFAYALVILPHRICKCGKCKSAKKCTCPTCKCNATRTTPFVPMEFALAEGLGKAPIAFVEEAIDADEIPLVAVGAKLHKYHRRELTNPRKWKEIQTGLLNLEREALRYSTFHIGLPAEDIPSFYKRLCKYLLAAKEVTIFNHSHLPLGSNFDPNDTGRRKRRRGSQGIQWRDRYFEFEEALLAKNSTRLDRTYNHSLDDSEKRLFELMQKRIDTWRAKRNGSFKLKRVLSIPDGADAALWDANVRSSVTERYISILQHIGRLEKTKGRQHFKSYQLCAFPTRTLHSLPTTIKIVDDYDTDTGVWGFLRNPEETSGEDAFIVTHNSTTAAVFGKHVDAFFSNTSGRSDEPIEVLVAENEWTSEGVQRGCFCVCKLINNSLIVKQIAKDLRKDFHQPGSGFRTWYQKILKTRPKDLKDMIIGNSR